MALTLERLRVFLAVAECQHFTKAALSLGLTQSAVSASVAGLEEDIGLRLFHRIGRRVELTVEGDLFRIEANRVMDAAKQAEAVAGEISGLARGKLTVMGSQTVTTYWLPSRLHDFRTDHPGIETTLGMGNTEQVVQSVLNGSCDIAVVEGRVEEKDLSVEIVAHDRMACVVGREFASLALRPLDRNTAAGLSWVLREPGSGTRAMTLDLLVSFGLETGDCRSILELPGNEAVRVAVEAGAGASVLSRLVAAPGLAAGSLVELSCPLPVRSFSLLRHRERHISRAARAFIPYLTERHTS